MNPNYIPYGSKRSQLANLQSPFDRGLVPYELVYNIMCSMDLNSMARFSQVNNYANRLYRDAEFQRQCILPKLVEVGYSPSLTKLVVGNTSSINITRQETNNKIEFRGTTLGGIVFDGEWNFDEDAGWDYLEDTIIYQDWEEEEKGLSWEEYSSLQKEKYYYQDARVYGEFSFTLPEQPLSLETRKTLISYVLNYSSNLFYKNFSEDIYQFENKYYNLYIKVKDHSGVLLDQVTGDSESDMEELSDEVLSMLFSSQ